MQQQFKLFTSRMPRWFHEKIETKDVEILYQNSKKIGCRYYNVINGREVNKCIGEKIDREDLYGFSE